MDTTSLPPPAFLRAKLRAQMTHLLVTIVMGWAVATLTHRPEVMNFVLAAGWAGSIFMFAGGAIALWRILLAVAINGVLFYLLARFVLPG